MKSTPDTVWKFKMGLNCSNIKFVTIKGKLVAPFRFSCNLGWYAQRKRTFRLKRYPDFSRCIILLEAQNSGNFDAMKKLTCDFVDNVHTTPKCEDK